MKDSAKLDNKEFRKELVKIMPGYKWTVHKSFDPDLYLEATGIQSSGFNRMSTLRVTKRLKDGRISYEAKSSGFGLRSPWLGENSDVTLARVLRGLQDHYEARASTYSSHAGALREGRIAPADGYGGEE